MGFLSIKNKKTDKESGDEKPRAAEAGASVKKSFNMMDMEPASKAVSAMLPAIKPNPDLGLQPSLTDQVIEVEKQASKASEAEASTGATSEKLKDGKESQKENGLNDLLSLFKEEKTINYELEMMTKDMKDVHIDDLVAQCQELMPLLRSRRAAGVG